MRPVRIWQGTSKTVNVTHDYVGLPSATQIEIYIDSPTQIVKTLGDGVSGVSTTNFVITFDPEDTTDTPSGEYELQARITTSSGSKLFGRLDPGRAVIRDSVFTDTD